MIEIAHEAIPDDVYSAISSVGSQAIRAMEEVEVPKGVLNREIGVVREGFMSGIGADHNPSPLSAETLEEMALDPQIHAGQAVVDLAVLAKGYDFRYPGEDSAFAQEMKAYLRKAFLLVNRNMHQVGGMWAVMRDVLNNGSTYGYSVSESVLSKPGAYGDDYIYPKKIKVLPNCTLEDCFRISDEGDLQAVIQNRANTNQVEFILPKDLYRLIIHSHNKKSANWYGISDLLPLWKDYYAKYYIRKFYWIYLERFAAPFLLGTVQNHNHMGRMSEVLDSARTRTCFTVMSGDKVESIETKHQGEAFKEAIHYLDEMLMRGLLVPTLLMGIEQTGARSLGDVHFTVFLWVVRNRQKELADTFQNFINKLIDMNFPRDKVNNVYPELIFPVVATKDMKDMADAIYKLVMSEIIAPDEAWIRQVLEVPQNDVIISTGGQYGSEKASKEAQEAYQKILKFESRQEKNRPTAFKEDYKKLKKIVTIFEKRFNKTIQDYLKIQEKAVIESIEPITEARQDLPSTAPSERNLRIQMKAEADEILEYNKDIFSDMGLSLKYNFSKTALNEVIEELADTTFKGTVDKVAIAAKEKTLAGLKAGMGKKELTKIVKGVYAGYTSNQIESAVATLVDDVQNAARLELYKANPEFVNGVRYDAVLDERTTKFCEFHDDMRIALNDPRIEYLRPPNHFHCLIDGQVQVFSVNGWKKIRDIEIGDLVLTHKGRFRKVTYVHHKQNPTSYDGEVVKLYFKIPTARDQDGKEMGITFTPEHPILTERGWVKAGELTKEDTVISMATSCKKCGTLIPWVKRRNMGSDKPSYCSESCMMSDTSTKMWEKPGHREHMSKVTSEQLHREYANGTRDGQKITEAAHAKMRELALEGKHPFQRPEVQKKNHEARAKSKKFRKAITIDRMGDKNWSKRPDVRKKMSDAKKRQYRENPDSHPNRRMGRKVMKGQEGYISKGQRQLFDMARDLLMDTELEFPVKTKDKLFFLDVALPDLKIGLEYDGSYWHKDQDKDVKRDIELQEAGWSIIRYRDKVPSIFELTMDVERLMANHNEEYQFTTVKISRIKKWTLKKARRLFNFAVEDDESYIVKGIVTHNCRSVYSPVTILEGPFKPNWVTGNLYPDAEFGGDILRGRA